MAIPGGFSFGDDLSAGKVLANKMKTNLHDEVMEFVKSGKLIIGVCNGFQVLVKYPLLPSMEKQEATLTFNDCGRFLDRWVYLRINEKSRCIWTRGITQLYLPIRHGEGKFVVKDENVRKKLHDEGLIALQYCDKQGNITDEFPWNPNGSIDSIAGICDKTGRIFGLMPHPEGYLYKTNHPRWTRGESEKGEGLKIFRNAVEYAEENLV